MTILDLLGYALMAIGGISLLILTLALFERALSRIELDDRD